MLWWCSFCDIASVINQLLTWSIVMVNGFNDSDHLNAIVNQV